MALLGDGYKIIADEFQTVATKIRLIGITIPDTYAQFVGIYDTRQDLVDNAPATEADMLGGVRDYNGSFEWFITTPLLDGYVWSSTPYDDKILSDGGFYQSALQDTTFTATTITNANPTGTPLKLSQPFVFELPVMPANTVGVVMQGIRFEDGSNNDVYDWGFGTDNWAGFSEPGEFIVSAWDFRLGGFPTT